MTDPDTGSDTVTAGASSGSSERMLPDDVEHGDTWVYESLVTAIPGVGLSESQAVALQIGVFEAGVLVLAWWYGLPAAVVPGTVAVAVAAAGSVAMLRISRRVRALDVPDPFLRTLFGSSVEVVLGVLAFVGLVTYLFSVDPQGGETPFMTTLLGENLPAPAVYLTLLVLWDLCYRIGTAWWLAVANLWGARRFAFDPDTSASVRRIAELNVVFGGVQAALLPFLRAEPVLFVAVTGHLVAVGVVSLAARLSVTQRDDAEGTNY